MKTLRSMPRRCWSGGTSCGIASHPRGWCSKKTPHAGERDTPRVGALRGHFRRRVAAVDPGRLVFVDESGINTSMTRARGRAPPGERVAGAVLQRALAEADDDRGAAAGG